MLTFSKNKKIITGIVILAVVAAVLIAVFLIPKSEEKAPRELIDLGMQYLDDLDFENAILYFREALRIDPMNEEAKNALADSYQRYGDYLTEQGDYEKAAEMYAKLAELLGDGGDTSDPRDTDDRQKTDTSRSVPDMQTDAGTEPDPADEEIIVFNDPALEKTIREALDRPVGDITAGEAKTLRALSHDGFIKEPVFDIGVLRYFTGLEFLSLENNGITDISPLRGLTGLSELDLLTNQISDLSPLENLTNLQQLYLEDNRISDITPLQGLTNLVWLDLYANQIRDVSPLRGLKT